MVLDKQSRELLRQKRALNLPPIHTISPRESRKEYDARVRLPGPQLPKVKYISIPVDGININCRMYIPDVNKILPVLVWFHGGGWVIGNVAGSDSVTRHLASSSGCAVLSDVSFIYYAFAVYALSIKNFFILSLCLAL